VKRLFKSFLARKKRVVADEVRDLRARLERFSNGVIRAAEKGGLSQIDYFWPVVTIAAYFDPVRFIALLSSPQ
jgi:hypothetical protein